MTSQTDTEVTGAVWRAGVRDSLREQSRRAAVITALAVLFASAATIYGVYQITITQRSLDAARGKEAAATARTAELDTQYRHLEERYRQTEEKTGKLRDTQNGILNFLAQVSDKQRIKVIDSDVDWERTKRSILELPPGRRQEGALIAVLLAWKHIPFKLGGRDPGTGMDSTTFALYVMRSAGVDVRSAPGERPSEAIMRTFQKTDRPIPADLMMYKGNVGNFAMIYLGPGQPGGQGTALGTFETGEPVQVIDSVNLNTDDYPFLGYFRVPY